MTAPTREPGTSVARTSEQPDRALAGLDAEGRRQVLEQRMRRTVLQAVANESWGQALSGNAQRAIAAYMVRFNLDVGEVEILGGKVYRNGRYYERRIAEMRSAGKVDWSAGEHIGPDARLDALAASGDQWAVEESTHRLRERIRWAVPEDATHAYVTRVKLKGDQNPLEGCDWITPKRTKKTKFGDKLADPVGAEEPEKTVITRAWRRAGLLVAAEIPELRQQEEALDAGAVEVAAEVEQITSSDMQRERAIASGPEGRARVPAVNLPLKSPDDPYSDVDESKLADVTARDAIRVEATPRTEAHRVAASQAANQPDLFASEELPFDDRDLDDEDDRA